MAGTNWTAVALMSAIFFFILRFLVRSLQAQHPATSSSSSRPSRVATSTGSCSSASGAGSDPFTAADVAAVRDLLPDLSRQAVETELRRTRGSVPDTIDRFLTRTTHLPYVPRQADGVKAVARPTSSQSDTQTSRSSPAVTKVAQPKQVWAEDGDARQESFQQRRDFMLQQARE